MGQTRYIDPNSGAASQPGGHAVTPPQLDEQGGTDVGAQTDENLRRASSQPSQDQGGQDEGSQLISGSQTDTGAEGDGSAGSSDQAQELERPAGNASRAEWAQYAEAKGATEEETRLVEDGGLTRSDLISKYGS